MKLTQCKGQPCVPKEGTINCPLHDCAAQETDWRPEEGIDPQLREFQCTSRATHAIYKRKTPRSSRETFIPKSLDGQFSCMLCLEFFLGRKALKDHILEKHS